VLALAQRPGQGQQFPNGNGNTNSPDSTVQEVVDRVSDTIPLIYVFANNPAEKFTFSDSLLHNHFHQYDPTRTEQNDYANLGNMGSAHRPIVYEPAFRKGFDVGLHQFDLYKIDRKKFEYYDVKPSITNLYYSQGPEQNDAFLKAKFNRKFGENFTFSVEYKRLLHSLDDDEVALNNNAFYKLQGSKNTALAVGFRQKSKDGKYDAFLTYISSQMQQLDHGGLRRTEMVLNTIATADNLDAQTSVPIYLGLETAKTRHAQQEIAYTHHYRLNALTDSTGTVRKRNFRISHEAAYANNIYKFSDTSSDTSYYQNFGIDDRGLRQYTTVRSLQNEFNITTFKNQKGHTRSNKLNNLLTVGLQHSYHKINQEPVDTTVNNLFLTGRFNFSLNDKLRIETYAHLGLWNNAGDYRIDGSLYFDFGKLGSLQLKAIQQLYEPNLMQSRIFISQQLFWENDFSKTLETSIAANYYNSKLDINLGFRNVLLNNYIYYDELGTPQQSDNAVNVLQFSVEKNFKFWKIHLDNYGVVQQSSSANLPVPSLYSQHSLYLEDKIFKKVMLARIGLDMRFNTNYFAPFYLPLTGQFHNQNDLSIGLYPAVDAFLSFKVDRFRFFIKMENLTTFVTNQTFYQTPYYPEKEMYLRFGISWRFLDAENLGNSQTNRGGGGGNTPITGGGFPR